MIRIGLSAVTLTLALASPAFASDDPHSVTVDGETYTYTSTNIGDATVLEGTVGHGHGAFRFVVRGGRVTGYANGVRVAFNVKDAERADVTVTKAVSRR